MDRVTQEDSTDSSGDLMVTYLAGKVAVLLHVVVAYASHIDCQLAHIL